MFPDDLEHLGSAETIYPHIFRDLRHVTAVRRLMKHDVDVAQSSGDSLPIGNIAFAELDVIANPGRFAFSVRLRLKIIENPNPPAFAFQQVG